MPCNIGYKSFAKVEIPAPVPQVFSSKSKAPEIDADLLKKLGVEDATFLEWVKELDAKPLLEEALKRTLAKINAKGITFVVNNEGMLEAQGSFTSAAEKTRLAKLTEQVTNEWQFEILGIVTELLNYTPRITKNGDELVLVAEEVGKSHPCDYIKVTKKGGKGSVCFEHFKSRGALDVGMAKFLVLADKLGVKISLGNLQVSQGDPVPGETHHAHGHGHWHSHGDSGHHHHH